MGPTIAGAPSASPLYTVGTDTTSTDSVIGGYGCNPTGGLDYPCFEYEPCTGTEYVVCPDTTVDDPDPSPTPTPTPAPGPTSPTLAAPTTGTTSGSTTGTTSGSTPGGTTTQDSVQSGYGSGSTGGIDYDRFEYDPETGTEPVVPDTTTGSGTSN